MADDHSGSLLRAWASTFPTILLVSRSLFCALFSPTIARCAKTFSHFNRWRSHAELSAHKGSASSDSYRGGERKKKSIKRRRGVVSGPQPASGADMTHSTSQNNIAALAAQCLSTCRTLSCGKHKNLACRKEKTQYAYSITHAPQSPQDHIEIQNYNIQHLLQTKPQSSATEGRPAHLRESKFLDIKFFCIPPTQRQRALPNLHCTCA